MDLLDGVASVANVVSAAATGAGAFSSEGPGQAHWLTVVSGNGRTVSTHHVGDGGVFAITKALHEAAVGMSVEGRS